MCVRARLQIALFFFLASAVSATTLPKVTIGELFQQADVVAVVAVRSGEVGECGARYEARVVTPIKGINVEETIVFGPFSGHAIGGRYLLFLTRSEKSYTPVATTNSLAEKERAEFEQRCRTSMPAFREMFEGMGSLEVRGFGSARGVVVPTKWIALPDSVNYREWPEMPDSILGITVQVPERELVDALLGLNEQRGQE